MKNGKVEDKLIGLQDTDKLRKFVDKVVKKWFNLVAYVRICFSYVVIKIITCR